ncbi:MAG: NUDIX domain-containing protein [Chloroflexi bacterium]|nr:NUDIX domain-containing protein [Chloroflexota bacterium]MDA1240844.1 NUDIX domain-containing protein [Chloroflexota bacterium]
MTNSTGPRNPDAAPVVATILVIFGIVAGRLQVLLVHRSAEPERDRWALPGGRWRGDESLEGAAHRNLVRETGVSDLYLEQLFTTSGLDPQHPSVAVAYFALVEESKVRLREEEAWLPAWHPVDDLPALAFDNNRVIEQAVRRVGAKLDYTNIAYGLLPEEFTLRQLQTAYEAVLREPLDRRNFRKRMISTGLIEAAGGSRREGAHRPATLYRFVSREPVFL